MGTKGEQLAGRFEEANKNVIKAVEEASESDWKAQSAEGWTVAATAHHIGTGHSAILGIVQAVASGQKLPGMSFADLDAPNAQHAKDFANAGKQETLDLLRSDGKKAAEALRALSDEQLANASPVITGMPDMTAEQVVEMVLIGHPTNHLQSIQTAVSGS